MTNSFKEVVLKAGDSILNLQIHGFKLMSVIQIISLAELNGKNCAHMSSGGGWSAYFVLSNTYHSWQWASGFHKHLNIKHLHLHLLITGKNIYPVNLLPLFIFTYCFSTSTQVNLDPSLLTFPTHLYVATYKFYLLAFSRQHRYTGNTLAMAKPKDRVKLKRISSTCVQVMGVELQVSGHRSFASGATGSSIYS